MKDKRRIFGKDVVNAFYRLRTPSTAPQAVEGVKNPRREGFPLDGDSLCP